LIDYWWRVNLIVVFFCLSVKCVVKCHAMILLRLLDQQPATLRYR